MAGYTLRQRKAIAAQLGDVYREGETRILERLASGNLSEWSMGFYRQQLKQIQAVLGELDQTTARWAQVHVPGLYADGAKAVDSYFPALREFSFTRLHAEAVELITANLRERLSAATSVVGRQVTDAFRQAGLRAIQQGLIGGDTTREISKGIVGQLQQRGLTAFTDKAGRDWSLRDYANMVARTTTREAETEGLRNRMYEAGGDLVRVSSHGDACPLCEPWEGEVLSLSGDSTEYPSVDEAEADGLFHPNCLHVLTPEPG